MKTDQSRAETAVSGDDRPRRAMMKQIEASRYRNAERFSLIA